MDLKLKTSCPSCSQPYILTAASPDIAGRIPLNLKCGHSTCDTCIKKAVKHKEPLECRICCEVSNISDGDLRILQDLDNVRKVFHVNLYMLGEMLMRFREGGPKNASDIQFENLSLYNSSKKEDAVDLYAIITQPMTTKKQCNECNAPTATACRQCAIPLCDVCFNRIHVFKSLATHNKEPVDACEIMCPLHSDKPLEFYCETCNKTLCSTCKHLSVDKCDTHITLKEKNAQCLEELKATYESIDELFRRLTVTAVSLDSMLNGVGREFETDKLASSVRLHFTRVHAAAQSLEERLLSRIDASKYQERTSMQKCLKESIVNIVKIKLHLAKLKTAQDPSNSGRVNILALLDEAKSLKEIPWSLSKNETDKLEFKVEEKVIEQLREHASLRGTGVGVCLSVPGPDETVPPAPSRPAVPQKMIRDVREPVDDPKKKSKVPCDINHLPSFSCSSVSAKDSRSKKVRESVAVQKKKSKVPRDMDHLPSFRCNSVSSNDSSSISSANTVVSNFSRNNIQKVQPYNPLEEGSMEEVYVSHINNPGDFYVQRACFQSKLRELMRNFQQVKRNPHPQPHDVIKGKVFLGFFKPDNLWHRCRVISVEREDVSQPIYHVFFYDYGPQDYLTIENLRVLPNDHQLWPTPLALHCELFNVVPINRQWTPDDALFMLRMLKNKKSALLVRRTMGASPLGLSLQCELATNDDGVNVSRALVFHGRAKFIETAEELKLKGVVDMPTISKGPRMRVGVTENVIITHIETPELFYIRKARLESSYEKLNAELETLYDGPQGSEFQVFCPEPGMCVAVQVGDPQNSVSRWRRGTILASPAPSPRGVHLFLPDTGHMTVCPLSRIRLLPQSALAPHAMAEECYLSHVTKSSLSWMPDAIEILLNFLNQQVSITVVENKRVRSRDVTGVCLYSLRDDAGEMLCINEELVRLGFALKIGVPLHRPIVRAANLTRTHASRQPYQATQPKPARTAQVGMIKVLPRKIQNKADETDSASTENQGPIKIEVVIVNNTSPSQIYVMVVSQREAIETMSRKMQEAYGAGNQPKVTECSKGDRVVTKTPATKWARAVVTELEGTTASVFFFDLGITSRIDVSELYVLREDFASVRHGVFKCHLAGINPASGDKWPYLTCEFLQDTISEHDRFYITKRGEIVDKSLPIELWVYQNIPGAALEPDRGEWLLINRLIVEQGLAVPNKRDEPQPSTSTEEETLSIFNLSGTIDEWLQLEPIKKEPKLTPTVEALDENEPTVETNEIIRLPDWPPAMRPQKTEFVAVPTFLDMDFVIYLHDVANEDSLDMIRRALDSKYKDSVARPLDTFWSPGQPAVAQFDLDKAFYRARVLQQHDNGMYQVLFVDYGNIEIVNSQSMRKSLAMTSTPIQAIKCQLHNIAPMNGIWREVELDFVHSAIVEKKCIVKIVGEKVNDIYPIEMKLGNTDISAMLVSLQYSMYKDDLSFRPILQPAGDSDDEDPNYPRDGEIDAIAGEVDWNRMIEESCAKYKIPLLEDTFLCVLMSITTESVVDVCLDDDITDFADFDDLMTSLRQEGDTRPALTPITIGKPCIARFSDDNLWYRALVISENEGKYRVQYIDFGNDEEIEADEIRTIKKEWMVIPAKCMTVKLHGLTRAPGVDLLDIFNHYTELFGDKTLQAKVLSRIDGLTVELYDENTNQLAYQPLLDRGLLFKTD